MMNQSTLLLLIDLIDLARFAVAAGRRSVERFEAHRDAIRTMVAEEREPTEAERQAIADDISALRGRLHRD